MNLDLRVPIGLFFISVGLIMAIFGLTGDPAIYHKSLGINVNLDWGIVELIFGSLMLVFGLSQRKREQPVPEAIPLMEVPASSAGIAHPPKPTLEPPIAH